jgi:hypothetical protein
MVLIGAGALLGRVGIAVIFGESADRGWRFAGPGGELRSVLGGVLIGAGALLGRVGIAVIFGGSTMYRGDYFQ